MLISEPVKFEMFGAVKIYDVSRVLALDGAGLRKPVKGARGVDRDTISDYAARSAIVIPVKDEDMLTLENILRAIPLETLIIMVSASSRKPVDRVRSEVELARIVGRSTGREIVYLYQFDPAWGEVLRGTTLEPMLGDGTVRAGKGEGMILGVIAAAALGRHYVGFIDSDNYVPGAALEYSWLYYTVFALSRGRKVMVRIVWPFKGKLASSDMYLRRRGRVSMHTNAVLNTALSRLRRIETDIVRTANSGEHAMSMDVALSIDWAGGFAVEPYQLVWLLERCYVTLDDGSCPFTPDHVDIYQVEPRNPHIHAERGDEHITSMISTSLGTIYHSTLASDEVKSVIEKILGEYGESVPPPKPRVYSLRGVNPASLFSKLISTSNLSLHIDGD